MLSVPRERNHLFSSQGSRRCRAKPGADSVIDFARNLDGIPASIPEDDGHRSRLGRPPERKVQSEWQARQFSKPGDSKPRLLCDWLRIKALAKRQRSIGNVAKGPENLALESPVAQVTNWRHWTLKWHRCRRASPGSDLAEQEGKAGSCGRDQEQGSGVLRRAGSHRANGHTQQCERADGRKDMLPNGAGLSRSEHRRLRFKVDERRKSVPTTATIG